MSFRLVYVLNVWDLMEKETEQEPFGEEHLKIH